jgi:hypothetical protein
MSRPVRFSSHPSVDFESVALLLPGFSFAFEA